MNTHVRSLCRNSADRRIPRPELARDALEIEFFSRKIASRIDDRVAAPTSESGSEFDSQRLRKESVRRVGAEIEERQHRKRRTPAEAVYFVREAGPRRVAGDPIAVGYRRFRAVRNIQGSDHIGDVSLYRRGRDAQCFADLLELRPGRSRPREPTHPCRSRAADSCLSSRTRARRERPPTGLECSRLRGRPWCPPHSVDETSL